MSRLRSALASFVSPPLCPSSLLLLGIVLLIPATAWSEGGDLLWVFQGIEDINTMATMPDADGDLVPDILVETYDAGASGDHLYLLSGGSNGTPAIIWSARPESGASNGGGWGDNCLTTSPDLNGDGFPDVLLGTAWGNRSVHALDGLSGDVIWTFDTYNETASGWIYSVQSHPDRTGDRVPEVVFGAGSDNNNGYMLDGATGQPIWRFYGTSDAIMLTLSLPDMNADEVEDVLFCGADYDHNVYCVSGASNGTGVQIWSKDTGASNHAATLIDDLDGDTVPEIVIGNWSAANQVRCFDGASGQVEQWSFHNGSYNYIMRLETISDVDQDGFRDVAIGSWARAVRVISGRTGQLIWESYAGSLNGGDFWTIHRVDDVTGDGLDEVVGGSFDTKVYLFDGADGDTLWMYNTGNRLYSVRGTADLSGNGMPDVLGGTQYLGSGGRAYALEGTTGPTGVSTMVWADGLAEVTTSRPGQVELRWGCNEALPFNIYRYEEVAGKAAGRRLLAQAFARGELRSREVIQTILAEDKASVILLTEQPVLPGGQTGGQWRYAFTDDLESDDNLDRYLYRLAAVLPDGGEIVVLELTPAVRSVPTPVILTAEVHPNPFNPATTIRFELEREALISLVVHDLRGRRVASLPAEWYPSGNSEIRWLARNEAGQALSSGVYSLTLMAGGETRSLRAVLVK